LTPFRSPLHRPASLVFLAATLLVTAPLSLAERDPPRTLTGTVTDHGKEPLKGAVVEVEDETTSAIVSYLTEADGTFSFKRLSSLTDYRVTATYRGHRSKPQELSHFDSNAHPVLHFVIPLD
jgi:hypothetical protein